MSNVSDLSANELITNSTAVRARPVPATHLPAFVFPTSRDVARHAAQIVARLIRERSDLGQTTVLGLPTGSTPVGTYRELIRLHQDEGLDFSNVIVFCLDEFYGLSKDDPQCHSRWLHEHFFNYVNLKPEHIHCLNSEVPLGEVELHCRRYEEAIQNVGGFDLVILGIGRNGHIGFNEPFSMRKSRTRLCTLDPITRQACASDFFGEANVPTQGLTVGLATILSARHILLLALGEHKADVIRETLEGAITDRVPASYLQEHPDARALLDLPAAGQLTAIAKPWLVEKVDWTEPLIKRAVLWLCEQTGKALLKLDDEDFRQHDLHQLLRHHGPAQRIAHRVFRWMQETIEYHPAGKTPKRCLCMSPHPDDDVISMGGTLIRLVEDGHEVHIAYMTSGNIAVFDHDALRVADLVTEYNRLFSIDQQKSLEVQKEVHDGLTKKRPGQPDNEAIQRIKALIRWSEARAGAMHVGCKVENLHFLDLPFYRTGTIAKRPLSEEDLAIIRHLFEEVQPDQLYVAGDLADPHGTHRVCAEAIFTVLEEMRREGKPTPEVLLYRGAWQEYALHEIEIAVPLSPSDIELKRQAIFMHESQKDEALFPGSDPREFWQRAEDRNKGTADKYNQIGLPEFYAMEAFTRWDGRNV
ncbi:MAG: glucosamine-6-phosphate deaminase [Pirellulaceae bacterium]|nr:MAG: glucosamine-6-phosphate deaminase [Pirellulaceae bacterium]